jgi:hypothetical protein
VGRLCYSHGEGGRACETSVIQPAVELRRTCDSPRVSTRTSALDLRQL